MSATTTPHPATELLNGLRDLVRQVVREELRTTKVLSSDLGPREIRLSKGIDLQALAAISGISDVSISRIERGIVRSPKAQTLNKIARALKVPEGEYRAAVASLINRRSHSPPVAS